LRYRAASAVFNCEIRGEHENYPDVRHAIREWAGLGHLVDECTSELAAFGRFIGRNPCGRGSVAAAALLPGDLRHLADGAMEELGRRINRVCGRAGSTAAEILEIAGIEVPADGRIPASSMEALGWALDSINVAMEPDGRYGSGTPRADEQVCLFRATAGGPIDPERPAFRAMRLQVEVMLLACAADGEAVPGDLERVKRRIRSEGALSGLEQDRLAAFAETMLNSPPKRARVLSSLAEIGLEDRERTADAAIAVIADNRTIGPDEVRFLERLQQALGLPRDRFCSSLHHAAAAGDDAVRIARKLHGPGLRIDAARLAQAELETRSVSVLLADIFAGDEGPGVVRVLGAETTFQGLDGPHAALLERLQSCGLMPRGEFDLAARALRLLPDGAIECINDWWFDRFEERLIEQGDEVMIAQDLRVRLAAMRDEPV